MGRWLSALCGLVTTLACYRLTATLFDRRARLIAAGFWAIVPYAVWHERMALVDPLMVCGTALALLFSLRLVQVERSGWALGYAFLVGLALAVATLTKFSAIVVTPTPLLALLVLYPPRQWANRLPRVTLSLAVYALVSLTVIGLYGGQWSESQQSQKLGGLDWGGLLANGGALVEWSYAYLTLPLFLALPVAAGLLLGRASQRRIGLWLLLQAFGPLLAILFVARIAFPRYMLFGFVPLAVLIGGGLVAGYDWLKTQTRFKFLKDRSWSQLLPSLAGLLLVLLSLPALWFDCQSLLDPTAPALVAALPQLDRYQYIAGDAAGSSLDQIEKFLQDQAGSEASRQSVLLLSRIYLPGRANPF